MARCEINWSGYFGGKKKIFFQFQRTHSVDILINSLSDYSWTEGDRKNLTLVNQHELEVEEHEDTLGD